MVLCRGAHSFHEHSDIDLCVCVGTLGRSVLVEQMLKFVYVV